MILDSRERIEYYTKRGWWGNKTAMDFLDENIARNPKEDALVDPLNRSDLDGSKSKRFTYAQLGKVINRVALHLLELGVKKDDFVMVQLPNVVELAVCYFAVAKIGAIISPVAVQYRTHELKYVMNHLEPKLFVTLPEFHNHKHVEMIRGLSKEMPFLKHIISVGEGPPPEGVISFEEIMKSNIDEKYPSDYLDDHPYKPGANEIWTLCWTSGTEALPKAVPRTHNQWLNIGLGLTYTPKLWMGDSILLPFPLINLAAIAADFIPWLLTGGKLVLHHPFQPEVFVKQLEEEKINYTAGAPAILTMLAQREDLLPSVDISNLRAIGCGSAPPSPWLINEYKNKYRVEIFNLWGANEGTLITNNADEIPDPNERAVFFKRWGAPVVRSSIWFAERVETKLVGLDGREVTESGIPGELWYKGPNISPCYYKQPEYTKKAFTEDGFYKTGDVFSIEGDKLQFYKFHGRLKDLIIRGGQNISPEEVENLALGHPKVRDAAAIGVPDPRLGERVCLYVVPKEGETVTLEEIVAFMREKDIAVYKLPEILEIVGQIPRNPVGKIQKNTLREDYATRHKSRTQEGTR